MTVDKDSINTAVSAFGPHAQQFATLTLADANRLFEELVQALDNDNAHEAGIAAHSLKSIMKQTGAMSLADVTFTIEQAGKNNDLATCKQALPALQENFASVKQHLETLTA
ncbi:MAG: Hpt domain-containing protein [Alcanivorax sp.]